jgi:hypothetical protein
MNRTYKNLVFTKHALERLSDRTITQDAIYQTVQAPDRSLPGQGNTKFIRAVSGRLIHVVAAPIKKHQWLVVSVWVRGEEDREPLAWQIITLPFRLVWKIWSYFSAKIAGKK